MIAPFFLYNDYVCLDSIFGRARKSSFRERNNPNRPKTEQDFKNIAAAEARRERKKNK